MKKVMSSFVLCALAFLVGPALGNNAEIMMLPTRVVMQGNDRYSTIVIKNTGNATGNFSVDLVDMKMLETGMVVPLDPNEASSYSAIPYIFISPRSFTLKPDETQNVRLMLRKPEGLGIGEYRAHVRVRLVDDDSEDTRNDAKDPIVSVRTHLVVVIPAIVRQGDTESSVGIVEPVLIYGVNHEPSIAMSLTRAGNRSVIGDVTLTWYPPAGESRVVKVFRGVSVYRPTRKRFISIPLDDLPTGVDLSRGKLRITYAAQEKEGGKVLAETPPLPLPLRPDTGGSFEGPVIP